MNPKLLLDINKTSYYLHDNLCELVISNIKKTCRIIWNYIIMLWFKLIFQLWNCFYFYIIHSSDYDIDSLGINVPTALIFIDLFYLQNQFFVNAKLKLKCQI